ncbi:MAG: hypothetical protein M1819_000728 [Sarea resinae]|nr:MAG: hypothetical protein M1819_000728 [Sarea resinae]
MPSRIVSFYNYPESKEGPETPYVNDPKSNPVIRGRPLSIGASIISWAGPIQQYLYNNAGFNSLRSIRELDGVEPRFDPTVIPLEPNAAGSSSSQDILGHPRSDSPLLPPLQHAEGRYYSVYDFHEAYTSGKLTPTAVAEALLPLIRRDTSPPGQHSVAFIEVREDLVLKAAEASTQRYRDGKSIGLLDGVPTGVKDEVDLAGYSKHLGSAIDFTSKDPEATSWCVRKWQEQGVVILGKLNMHEIGLDTTNNNPHYGTPPNPHNLSYYPGGSSGGSAYAVATGLIPIAVGADGGGSIRIPASFTGIYGLKPSHGRISGLPTPSLAPSNGVLGPLAANMFDLAVAYRILATPDPSHPTSSLFPHPPPISTVLAESMPDTITIPPELPTPRIEIPLGVYQPWFDRADPQVLHHCNAALDYLTQSHTPYASTVVPISLPLLPEAQTAHAMTILAEISSSLNPSTMLPRLSPANKVLTAVSSRTSAADLLSAQRLRNILMQHLSHLFQTHPGLIIMSPTTPLAGWPRARPSDTDAHGVSDANTSLANMAYVFLANFSGCPAISFPVGYAAPAAGCGEGEIPIGMMGMSEWGTEESLLGLGKWAERRLNGGAGGGVDQVQPAAAAAAAADGPRRKRPDTETQGKRSWVDVFEAAEQKMRDAGGVAGKASVEERHTADEMEL